MPITLGSNIASLTAQRRLAEGTSQLSKAYERLSSGMRINRASDDAAGLAIAESLKADRRVYTQGIRNVNDGISMLQIADSAIENLSGIVLRLKELAEQAGNGVYSTAQRKALDSEAQALSKEYLRIAQSTSFNGRNLFSAGNGDVRLQLGYGVNESILTGVGGAVGIGTLTSVSSFATLNGTWDLAKADFNGDGYMDIATSSLVGGGVSILLGTAGAGLQAGTTITGISIASSIVSGDYNNDGIVDLVVNGLGTGQVLLGNGNGTFATGRSFVTPTLTSEALSIDVNNDGNLDLVASDGTNLITYLGSGNGSLGAPATTLLGDSEDIVSADFNGDGILDIASADSTSFYIDILLGQGNGSFAVGTSIFRAVIGSLATADINGDGHADIIAANTVTSLEYFLGQGNGQFGGVVVIDSVPSNVRVETGDFNGDGKVDLFSVDSTNIGRLYIGRGNGTFETAISYSFPSGNQYMTGDFNNDGVIDVASADDVNSQVQIRYGNTRSGIGALLDFSLKTQSEARQALGMFTNKEKQLSAQRGVIGAHLSRTDVAVRVLGNVVENYSAAESQIRDADIAVEAAELVRLGILQKAASAILAQANQQPALVLRLLQGGK